MIPEAVLILCLLAGGDEGAVSGEEAIISEQILGVLGLK